ncbi:fimbrial biogenesis chaperone [Serratia sp. CY76391]|uniref:fimbrial biogenesis chaperone n=1 Tax=Serratia sp. CY76391 TaxID=3383681 RepID=UPI003FA087BC
MIKSRSHFIVVAFVLSMFSFFTYASGGYSLSKTRLVVTEGKDARIKIQNSSDVPLLIQSWVSFYNKDDASLYGGKPPFVVTPPLYRQGTGDNYVKVIPTGNAFPKDKESVFFFNAKAIPASAEKDKNSNTVSFSYTNMIKLFYRPNGLPGVSTEAYKQLTFSRTGSTLTVKNPTAYYITFSKISVGGRELDNIRDMVPPFGSHAYPLPSGTSGSIDYQTIDEFGGVTPRIKVSL